MCSEGNKLEMVAGKKIGLNQESKVSNAAVAEKFNPSGILVHDPNILSYEHFDSHSDPSKNNIQRASDLLVSVSACSELHKAKITNLAYAASEELRLMAQEREPLWIFDVEKGSEILNGAEYKRRFASLDPTLEEIIRVITAGGPPDLPDLNENIGFGTDNGCMSEYGAQSLDFEASRAIGVVLGDPISLVNMFMDVEKWSSVFCSIVSKATNLGVLSTRNEENPNGILQVMVAEFHVPSPLAKTRETYFVRCSRQVDISTWIVADISLENIFPNQVATCQRKPSGCVIQALQDGLSMVTWVEHNAVDNCVVNNMFRGILTSGCAFSAKRWISTLERQYDRISTLEAKNDSHNLSLSHIVSGAARNGLLKLAERMVRCFNANISSNLDNAWRSLPISGAEEILIKTSLNVDDPEIPRGVAVTIATSVWLPVHQNDAFNFLRLEHNRNKWDLLSYGLEIREILQISSARNSTDCGSVVSAMTPEGRTEVTYLQESFNDSTAFYVVYAPIDVPTMHHVLQGGGADSVAILPSGFAVLPDGSSKDQNVDGGTGNCILTVAFNIMDEQLTTPEYLPPQSVSTAYRLMAETIFRIRTALLPKF